MSKLFWFSNSLMDFSNSDIFELKLFMEISFLLKSDLRFLFLFSNSSYEEYLFCNLEISLFNSDIFEFKAVVSFALFFILLFKSFSSRRV